MSPVAVHTSSGRNTLQDRKNLEYQPPSRAILRRSVSEKRAFELITRGEVISATTAAEVGMINRVFPDDQFEATVEQYVSQLAAKSASAVSLAKSLLYHMDGMTFETAIEAGVQLNAITRMTEDCKRGVDRFLKK